MTASINRQIPIDTVALPSQEPPSDSIDPRWLLGVFRRRWGVFLIVASVIFLVVAAYTLHQKPVFTATASVMIDAQRLQLFSADHNQPINSGAAPDSNAVDTQVEVIRSRGVAEWVVKELRLDDDPEFAPSTTGSLGARANRLAVEGLHGGRAREAAASPADRARARHERIVDNLLGPLDVRRIGTTYVIAIDYTFRDPAKAAAIANAFADGYLRDDAEAKLSVDRDATDLLSSRLVDLSERAAQDTTAVQQYKIQHNLLATSGNTGSTLVEQEISNYNQQLATAKAQAAEDDARLSTARAQLARGSTGDDLGETLNSPVIQSLRAQRAIVSGQVAVLSTRYGPRYPDMLKAQRQLADLDIQIHAEINRIVSSLQAAADVSRQRVASTEQTLGAARDTLASNGRAQVGLLALEGKAAASQSLYDAYLTRFKETSTQVGTERPDARIVSRAEIPTVQTAPKVGLYLAFGAILALGAAMVAIFVAEALETGLMSAEDVEKKLGAPYLGSLPNLPSAAPVTLGEAADDLTAHPKSAFAEAFRSLRPVLMHRTSGEGDRVLGITSPYAEDGKTTTAVYLAAAAAMQGWKTVIVDCDLGEHSLSDRLPRGRPGGLVELLNGGVSLEAALARDPATGASILPITSASPAAPDLFSGATFAALLAELQRTFDLVILDMPAVLVDSDARILASRCGEVVMLARWRRTPRRAAQMAIRLIEQTGAHIAGVALTRVGARRGGFWKRWAPASARVGSRTPAFG
jgi:succinoglycan biosynthesis transport protein ExoP